MMKLNKKQTSMILMTVAILVAVYFFMNNRKKRSPYKLAPEPIKIEGGKDGDIFSLPVEIKCLSESYYTKDLKAGAICGDQAFVRSQAEDYKIIDGIGGSLLDQ